MGDFMGEKFQTEISIPPLGWMLLEVDKAVSGYLPPLTGPPPPYHPPPMPMDRPPMPMPPPPFCLFCCSVSDSLSF